MFLYCKSFSKRDIRKPTHSFKEAWQSSEFHSAHQTQSCLSLHNFIVFPSLGSQKLNSSIWKSFHRETSSSHTNIQQILPKWQLHWKTFRNIIFSKAGKIMLGILIDNAILTNHRPIQDTMRKLLRKQPMPWPQEGNKSKQPVLSFLAGWLQN